MAGPPSSTAMADGERRARARRVEDLLNRDPEREWFADEIATTLSLPARGIGATLAALERRQRAGRTEDYEARKSRWKARL